MAKARSTEARGRRIARKLKKREDQRKALKLASAGVSLDQIAKALGYKNKSTASRLVNSALDEVAKPLAERELKFRIGQLDDLLRVAYKDATDFSLSPKERHSGIARAESVINSIAKMRGIAAPIEHRHGASSNAAPIAVGIIDYSELAEMSDEELAEAVERASARARVLTAGVAAGAVAAGAGEAEAEASQD